MVLNQRVDPFATISTIAKFDEMPMDAKMNACTLGGVFAKDAENLRVTKCKASQRFLANLVYKDKGRRLRTSDGKGVFSEAIKFYVVDSRGAMYTLKVFAFEILTLEVTNASGGAESKTKVSLVHTCSS